MIPKAQTDSLSRTLLNAIEQFYLDPENVARYERWLRSPEGQKYTGSIKTQTGGIKNV